MLIAHVSDTHLGYAQYGLEERENDFMSVFREAVEKALEEHVDVIVHSGDVFHSPRPRIKTLREFREVVRRLWEKGVPLVVVPGSHDMQRRRGVPPVMLFDDLGVRVLTTKNYKWEYNGVLFAGFQYLPRHRRQVILELLRKLGAIASGFSGKTVLMLHQGLRRLLPTSYELSIAELPGDFHYYAFGHVHKPFKTSCGRGVLAYPGSTENVDVTEISYDKGFYLVDLSGDQPELSRVKLEGVRPQLLYEVKPEELSSTVRRVIADVSKCGGLKPVVHFRVLGDVDRREFEKVSSRLRGLCLKVRVEVKPPLEEGGEGYEVVETLDLKTAIESYLRAVMGRDADRLASMAYDLFLILSSEGYSEREAIARAVKEVEGLYGVRSSED